MKTRRKAGEDVTVGDALVTWCGVKTIESIRPHPRYAEMFPGYQARIVTSGEWEMTLEHHLTHDVLDV